MVKSKLSIVAFIATLFGLIVAELGAFTRLIDAGLGCPDWPGCYGHLVVPQDAVIQFPDTPLVAYKAWAEMIHRYFVGGLSLLIMIVVGMLLFNVVTKNSKQRFVSLCFALALIAVLIYQILLGQWTVTLKLMPIIVTQHLLGGFLIITLLWLVFLTYKSPRFGTPVLQKGFILSLATIGLILLVFQLFLGAWTSTNYASLSCPDFPFCENEVDIPFYFKEAFNLVSPVGINYEGGILATVIRQTIQMAHRFGALIVSIYLMVLLMLGFHYFKNNQTLLKNLYLIMGLLLIQISLGIINVLFKLPLLSALLHNLCAILLLLSLVTLIFNLIHLKTRAGKEA